MSLNNYGHEKSYNPDVILRKAKQQANLQGISRKDVELFALILGGFSNRELKVIYQLKELEYVYTKRYRLKKRLLKHLHSLISEDKTEQKRSKKNRNHSKNRTNSQKLRTPFL